VLGLQAEAGAAGRQHFQSRRGSKQIGHQCGRREEVLKVVEQEQNATIPKVVPQDICYGSARLFAQPQGCGSGRRDQVWIGLTGKIDHKCAVGEGIQRFRRNSHPQPRLADSTGAGKGRQSHIGS
jgi:hypothetical protein